MAVKVNESEKTIYGSKKVKNYILRFTNNDSSCGNDLILFDKDFCDNVGDEIEVKKDDKVIGRAKIEKDDIGLYFTELLTTLVPMAVEKYANLKNGDISGFSMGYMTKSDK